MPNKEDRELLERISKLEDELQWQRDRVRIYMSKNYYIFAHMLKFLKLPWYKKPFYRLDIQYFRNEL